MLAPVRRFRCANFSCGWEGNWPVGREGAARRSKKRLPLVFVASMAFIGASALASVVFGLLGLLLPGLQRTIGGLFGL